jgi:hypothetical protein
MSAEGNCYSHRIQAETQGCHQADAPMESSRYNYWADVPALGDNHVRVSERVKREFGDILLTTGA